MNDLQSDSTDTPLLPHAADGAGRAAGPTDLIDLTTEVTASTEARRGRCNINVSVEVENSTSKCNGNHMTISRMTLLKFGSTVSKGSGPEGLLNSKSNLDPCLSPVIGPGGAGPPSSKEDAHHTLTLPTSNGGNSSGGKSKAIISHLASWIPGRKSPAGNSAANSGVSTSKPRRWTQVVSLLPVYLLQVCYGMNTGYPAIMTPQLSEPCSEFSITTDQESWIVSMDSLAAPLICIMSGFLQQQFGPLKLLVFTSLPYTAGWIIAALATSYQYLYASRFLVGISHAFLTTSVYTVEISSPDMRGTYSLMESVLRCLGVLLIYSLGYAFRWKQIAIFATLVPILAFLVCLLMAAESPVYLVSRSKYNEAKAVLCKLYGPGFKGHEEVEIIRMNLEQQRKRTVALGGMSGPTLWSHIQSLRSNPAVYKPFFVIIFLGIIQQFSGMSVLRAYVVKIFDEVFQDSTSQGSFKEAPVEAAATEAVAPEPDCSSQTSHEAYLSAIVIGLVRFLASLLLSKLLLNHRRRSMYFVSALTSILSIISFATCNLLIVKAEQDPLQSPHLVTALKWTSLCTACLLVFSVQLGVQTLPLLLSGELFPAYTRSFSKGLTRSIWCILLVATLKMFPWLEKNVGIYGSFYIFGSILILLTPIVYFILPETKDVSLEMIENYFIPKRTVFYVDLESYGQPPPPQKASSCSKSDTGNSSLSLNPPEVDGQQEDEKSSKAEFCSSKDIAADVTKF